MFAKNQFQEILPFTNECKFNILPLVFTSSWENVNLVFRGVLLKTTACFYRKQHYDCGESKPKLCAVRSYKGLLTNSWATVFLPWTVNICLVINVDITVSGDASFLFKKDDISEVCYINTKDRAHVFKALVSGSVPWPSGSVSAPGPVRGHGTVSMCVCGCHRNCRPVW